MRINEIKTGSDLQARVKKFAEWAIEHLDLQRPPRITYSNDIGRVKDHRTFGTTLPDSTVWVYLGNRNAADIMRTLVHELIHCKQFEVGTASSDMDEQQRQAIEDEANALAGRVMRIYGRKHGDIYEWKMSKSLLSKDEFTSAYEQRQKTQRKNNPDIPYRPGHMLAETLNRLKVDKLWESTSEDIKELKKFQKYVATLDRRSSVSLKPGNKISVLQFEPHTYLGVIEVKGFLNPKKIVDVEYRADGIVDWIEFDDRSTWPDREFLHKGKGGGEYEGLSTLFFPDSVSAEQALFMAKLHGATSWDISTISLREQTLTESRADSLPHKVSDSLPHASVISSPMKTSVRESGGKADVRVMRIYGRKHGDIYESVDRLDSATIDSIVERAKQNVGGADGRRTQLSIKHDK